MPTFRSAPAKGDEIPAVWLSPSRVNADVAPTLIVHPGGIASVMSTSLVKTLLGKGGIVMSIDAFQTGSAVTARDTSNRAYLHFNQTNDANRVQDIVTALEYLRSRSKAQTVNLVGLETAVSGRTSRERWPVKESILRPIWCSSRRIPTQNM